MRTEKYQILFKWLNGKWLHFYGAFIQSALQSASHLFTSTPIAASYNTSAALIIRSNFGFRVLPKDTVTCEQEQPTL